MVKKAANLINQKADKYLPKSEVHSANLEQRLRNLENAVDELIAKKTGADDSEKKAIVALSKELRLANNYTLTENLEKLGHSELASFDLFRKEKAQAKRHRQRLIEKLHILMGNEHEEPPEDEFCRDNKRHELIPVEIEGLPARAFKVPLNELRRLGQDAELEQVDTLLAEEIKSSADVEANPLALALLGVAEKVSGNGANLLKMVAQAPASLLAQWTEKTGTLGELKNVQIRDLKELFFEYLQKNGVVANEKVDRDQFVEMQVKQGLADILLKESCNEKDLVRFLNERSHRGLDRELLMEGFEQFTRIGQEEELSDRKQLKVVYEDLRTLVNLSKVGKFDVPFDVIKKVLVAFEKVANPIFEIYRMENEGHSYEKNPEIFDEFIEKSVIDIVKQEKRENAPADTEIIFADEERAPGLKVKTEDFEELIVVRKVIDSPLNKELTVPPEEEKSDEEPEEHKKLEFWEDEQITPEMCEMDNEIPRAEEFNLELERRKRVNRTGISKSMLEDIFSQGVFWGVRIPHQQKIFNALEMQKLARDTSNSRMKQYLLMYKVAETPLEQEFCLQRMRKELVSYGNFSADVLAKSDRFSHFELFVDALARQMEAQVGSGENAKMGKVVAQILDRKFVAKSSRLAFKEFLEERVGEKNGREEAEWSENVKESDNLKLSTAKLAELAKGVNIGGFLEKLELAVTGNWENKGKTSNFRIRPESNFRANSTEKGSLQIGRVSSEYERIVPGQSENDFDRSGERKRVSRSGKESRTGQNGSSGAEGKCENGRGT